MENIYLIYNIWPIGLFIVALLCALLSLRFPRRRALFSFLTAFFSEIGMIIAFIMGATMQEVMIPFLVLLWISLRSHKRIEGEEQ